MSEYICPRSDSFYYIEILDTQSNRDVNISKVLGESTSYHKKYYFGSSGNTIDRLCCARFWKTPTGVNNHLLELSKNNKNFILHILSRVEFINAIPLKIGGNNFHKSLWKNNIKLRRDEIKYIKKLENNTWRNYDVKDLSDILIKND